MRERFLKTFKCRLDCYKLKKHPKILEKYFGDNALQRLICLSDIEDEGIGE